MAIDIGDAVLTFLGDTTNLDQVFNQVGTEVPAKMAPAAAAIQGTSAAVEEMTGRMAVGANGATELGEITNLAGEKVKESMYEARGELGLLGEAFGIHLPRHVRSFVAELPGVGQALSAAFAATAVLFLIDALVKGVEKIVEWSQESHKLALAWQEFDTALANSMHGLDDKLLQAGIRIDDLSGNHIAALRKELELIDHQSLRELEGEFGKISKAADAMFAQLKSQWLGMEAGSTGAKHALDDFKSQYDLLLAEGKDKEAHDLLAGTLKSAKDMQKAMLDANTAADKLQETVVTGGTAMAPSMNRAVAYTERQVQAQDVLVRALEAQQLAQEKVNELAADNKQIKNTQEYNREIQESEKILKANAKEEQKDIADEEKRRDDARNKAITGLQQEEKEKLAATRQGSQARLDAINAAIKEEESKGLQDTAFYRSLQEQKVKFVEAALAEQEKAVNAAASRALKTAEERAKVETSQVTQQYSEQEKAVQMLASFKLLSAAQTSQKLELFYSQENNKLLKILDDLLKKEEAAVEKAQKDLSAAQNNPFASPQQIEQLKQLLHEAEQAVAKTQTDIAKTTKTFQDKQLSLDKGYYGQSLALAIAFGKQELAEKLKSTHAALLAAEAEKTEAKARGLNVTAIEKEIAALKKQEKEQEKAIHETVKSGQVVAQLKQISQQAYQDMAAAFFTATESMITGQESFGKAMEAATFKMLSGIAKHYADIYIAKGIGNLADMNFGAAALDFAAAAAFEAIGGALSGLGSNAGSAKSSASSGGTTVNNTSVSQNASTQTGGQPTAVINVPHLGGGAIATKPTLVMIGDGDNGGSQTEGVFPLGDSRARDVITELFGGHPGGGDTHNHYYLDGFRFTATDMSKLARQLSRGANTQRIRVTVANSSRLTRRS